MDPEYIVAAFPPKRIAEAFFADDLSAINDLLREIARDKSRAKKVSSLKMARSLMRGNGIVTIRCPEGRLIGMATLVIETTLTGPRGHVHDVVRLPEYEGRNIGGLLMEEITKLAKLLELPYLELTCNPARTQANLRYAESGFQPRATNVWRKSLVQEYPDPDSA